MNEMRKVKVEVVHTTKSDASYSTNMALEADDPMDIISRTLDRLEDYRMDPVRLNQILTITIDGQVWYRDGLARNSFVKADSYE